MTSAKPLKPNLVRLNSPTGSKKNRKKPKKIRFEIDEDKHRLIKLESTTTIKGT